MFIINILPKNIGRKRLEILFPLLSSKIFSGTPRAVANFEYTDWNYFYFCNDLLKFDLRKQKAKHYNSYNHPIEKHNFHKDWGQHRREPRIRVSKAQFLRNLDFPHYLARSRENNYNKFENVFRKIILRSKVSGICPERNIFWPKNRF